MTPGGRLVRDKRPTAALSLLGLLAIVLATAPHTSTPADLGGLGAASDGAPAKARQAYGKLPLSFVENRGQADRRVRFYAEGSGFGFFFSKRSATLAFAGDKRGTALALKFVGASPGTKLEGARRRQGSVNYLNGSNPSRWKTHVPTYSEVRYQDLWPGIDMLIRGRAGTLKYEFVVQPGADPSRIRLAYSGAQRLSLDGGGALVIHTPLGALEDSPPASHQLIAGKRVRVESRYRLRRRGAYGFDVPSYDPARPLVIDPGLFYSTLLGGSGAEEDARVAVDANGSAYVTGRTVSSDFPTTPGAFDTANVQGDSDAFVTKLNPAGSSLVYSTYLGGSGFDGGADIALDASGNAYLTGKTGSSDFPTTAGALDGSRQGITDGFVTKLNSTGSGLVYSTYLGGTGNSDEGHAIAVDANGGAYLTGSTDGGFPTTTGAFDRTFHGALDAFAAKLTATGSTLAYSTYLGGDSFDTGNGIAVDPSGNAYVTGNASPGFPVTSGAFDTQLAGGRDGFATKITPGGSSLAYSTFVGGSGDDGAVDIAVDPAGSAYVTGFTDSSDFPTTPGAFDTTLGGQNDGFVGKLNAGGTALAYATYLGGNSTEGFHDITVGAGGDAYVTGYTTSTDFPTTADAFDRTANGSDEAFATWLNPSGSSLSYSTYLGGTSFDEAFGIAIDTVGNVYVAGETGSSGFPTTSGAFDTSFGGGGADTFVTRLQLHPFYVRPKGATPVYASLVPAYASCSSPNSTHGAPLAFGSCSPPSQASQQLTVGTPEANGNGANFSGSVRLTAIVGNPSTPADEADVRFTIALTDVRRRSDLADYTGELLSSQTIRLTDRLSVPPDPGTVQDFPFAFPLPCAATADPSVGSTCAINTTADAVTPGAVPEQARTIWQLGQVQVFDGGADGIASTAPNTLFAVQGVFVP